jgi:hypothetical protein
LDYLPKLGVGSGHHDAARTIAEEVAGIVQGHLAPNEVAA